MFFIQLFIIYLLYSLNIIFIEYRINILYCVFIVYCLSYKIKYNFVQSLFLI